MKMKNIVLGSLSLVLLASCGESAPEMTLCDCVDFQKGMIEELGFEGVSNESRIEEFKTNNQVKFDLCDSLGQIMNDEMEALGPDEQEAKQKEFEETCPAFGELKTTIEDMQKRAYEEAMKQMQQGGLEDINLGEEEIIDVEEDGVE